jgi:hypothetical protein
MKRSKFGSAAALGIVGGLLFSSNVFAGSPVEEIYVKQELPSEETLVYVTGSRIPQRVRVWETGAATAWPVRIIRAHEISVNNTGRGTADIFVTEPSVRIIGH